MRRFAPWIGLPELEIPAEVTARESFDLATEGDEWRGAPFFIHELDGWTIFEDMSGYLSTTTAAEWLRLAGGEELIFAGYNDSILWGELIVIEGGRVAREFRESKEVPEENVNLGWLAFEEESPIQSWIEVASFVDGDEHGPGAENGTLWQFHRPHEEVG